MTRENKQGMHLRLEIRAGTPGEAWLVPMLTALAAYAALTYGLGTVFGLGQSGTLVLLLAAGAYVCLAYGLVLRFRREQWFFPAALALLLLLVLFGGRQVLEGYRLVWNEMRDAYTAGTGRVLPQWQPQLARGQWGLSRVLFALAAGGAAALLCCLLGRRTPALLAVLVPAAVLTGMAVFGTRTSLPGLVALGASAMLLLSCGWQERKAGAALAWCCLLLAAAIGAAALLASVPGVKTQAERFGRQARAAVHAARYETEYTILPEGDFTDYEKAAPGNQMVLKVTMSAPETMYLRGFTGCTLEGDTWKSIDTALLAQDQTLLYWLNRNAFFPAAQYAAASGGGEKTGSVTVQNIGACSRYRLVPFTLSAGEWLQPEDLRQDSLLPSGERTYGYSVASGGDMEQVLQTLQSSEEDWVRSYRKAESAYRDFVYRNYLQVPDAVAAMLADDWDEIAENYGASAELTPEQAQACVLTFLSRAFPENGTREEMELPLAQAAGTSYQYATVAAMTLRHYGIPARYAEGYVISKETAAGAEPGETLALDGSCARAWVEVYQDGIGWIPMELTPGLGEMLEPLPENGPGGGDGQSEDPSDTPPEQTLPEEAASQEPQPQGGTVTRVAKLLASGVLLLLLLLALVFLVLWIRRRVLCRRRAEQFGLADTSEAVSRIFAQAVVLLENLGLRRGNGSLTQLLEPARQRFGEDYAAGLAGAMELNALALFSTHPMTRDQREAMLKFYDETRTCLENNVKWYRRLWMKWVRCLY